MNVEKPDDTREGRDPAAESTAFRRSGDPPTSRTVRLHTSDTAFFGSGQSVRFHSRAPRSSLAVRLSVPVIAALVLALVALCVVARVKTRSMQLEDIRIDAASAAYMGSMFGRFLIARHNAFLRDNPDYRRKAEFRAGDYWLVTEGFVSESDWVDATGFQPDELAPASTMSDAGRETVLAGLGRFLNNSSAESEIVGMFVWDSERVELAAIVKDSFPFDASTLRAMPQDSAVGRYDMGNTTVAVDYIETLRPEPVMRGVARIFSDDGARERIGTVAIVMRTTGHFTRLNSLTLLLFVALALLTPAVGAVCWLSARRIAVPLRRLAADMQAIADGDYTRRAAVRGNDEAGMAAQAFNSMAERLRLARLNEQETIRLESDLSIAREIQMNLLPKQTPRVRGLDIHTAYRPAKEIGGDYFDFLPVDGEHMGLVVADASGKSVPAALVMSTARAILRFVAPGGLSAAETLTKMNAILSVDIPRGMFVTAYYVVLDPLHNAMLCASAGHTPLLIARSDGSVEPMNPGGIALGFDGGAIFQRSIREQRVRLESGDRVLLYTDGVVECVNPANEEYSDRRLREFIRRNRDLSSHDFVGALMADLDRHRGPAEMRDDTTIVTFRVL